MRMLQRKFCKPITAAYGMTRKSWKFPRSLHKRLILNVQGHRPTSVLLQGLMQKWLFSSQNKSDLGVCYLLDDKKGRERMRKYGKLLF